MRPEACSMWTVSLDVRLTYGGEELTDLSDDEWGLEGRPLDRAGKWRSLKKKKKTLSVCSQSGALV